MIWTRGEVIPDDALRISVLDRTFEHGLGLFESFRTWNGHPTLLPRHVERLQRSAASLGLPLDPADLPDVADVRRLHEATGLDGAGDVRLRLTLSGGRPSAHPDGSSAIVWMTAGPLPPPARSTGARIERSILVDPDDPLARHKTLNYWRHRIEQERAAGEGTDEVLCVTFDGLICEGTRSNIFLVRRDGKLITPDPAGPLLDGVMRHVAIDQARRLGIEVLEGPLPIDSIASAAEAFLTNSVRGMLPIARLMHAELPAAGPMTRRLWDHIVSWLETGGIEP